jgi:hypothetical protein
VPGVETVTPPLLGDIEEPGPPRWGVGLQADNIAL